MGGDNFWKKSSWTWSMRPARHRCWVPPRSRGRRWSTWSRTERSWQRRSDGGFHEEPHDEFPWPRRCGRPTPPLAPRAERSAAPEGRLGVTVHIFGSDRSYDVRQEVRELGTGLATAIVQASAETPGWEKTAAIVAIQIDRAARAVHQYERDELAHLLIWIAASVRVASRSPAAEGAEILKGAHAVWFEAQDR